MRRLAKTSASGELGCALGEDCSQPGAHARSGRDGASGCVACRRSPSLRLSHQAQKLLGGRGAWPGMARPSTIECRSSGLAMRKRHRDRGVAATSEGEQPWRGARPACGPKGVGVEGTETAPARHRRPVGIGCISQRADPYGSLVSGVDDYNLCPALLPVRARMSSTRSSL